MRLNRSQLPNYKFTAIKSVKFFEVPRTNACIDMMSIVKQNTICHLTAIQIGHDFFEKCGCPERKGSQLLSFAVRKTASKESSDAKNNSQHNHAFKNTIGLIAMSGRMCATPIIIRPYKDGV